MDSSIPFKHSHETVFRWQFESFLISFDFEIISGLNMVQFWNFLSVNIIDHFQNILILSFVAKIFFCKLQ